MAGTAGARTLSVPIADAGARLDRWLAAHVPELSRARLQALIDAGHVRIDGGIPKASRRLAGGEQVSLEIPPAPPETLTPELLAHARGTAGVGAPGRPGIVHRLDKDTSGLLVMAKTARAYDS